MNLNALIESLIERIQRLVNVSAKLSKSHRMRQDEPQQSNEATVKKVHKHSSLDGKHAMLDRQSVDSVTFSKLPEEVSRNHVQVTQDEPLLHEGVKGVTTNQIDADNDNEVQLNVEEVATLVTDTDSSPTDTFSKVETRMSLPLTSETARPQENDSPKVTTHKSPNARRYFDLSAHPQISEEDLNHFLRHGHIREDASWRYVDALLMAAFDEIALIGELPITETTFHQITSLVRSNFMIGNTPKVKKVHPALFITTMVFSTRYSDINTRSFWEPYAQLVWELDEASQYMQLQSRDHFRHCRIFLSERFEHLSFPIQNDGDVARPVFFHVLIPYYLQDDFANWLLQHFQIIVDTDSSLLPQLLKNENSLRYVPPRLQRFILGEDTADAAAALIMQMAEAVALHQDGETVNDILQMMTNPIEQAIWHTIADRLVSEADQREINRVVKPRLEWVWSLDDDAMRLRLTNIVSTSRPNLCVWVEADASADEFVSSEVAEPVIPWEQTDGAYYLDEVVLADGPIDGRIIVLSEDYEGQTEAILFDQAVPKLPNEPIVFFRITQQNTYGIPAAAGIPNTSGEWLVSMSEDITLHDMSGEIIPPRQPLYTPDILREIANHTRSGQFLLNFPISVQNGDKVLFEVSDERDNRLIQAKIIGHRPLPQLASNVPPAFENTEVFVVFSGYLQRLSRIVLGIRSQSGFSKVVRLTDIELEYIDGQTRISLSDILPSEPGVYRLNLRQDLKPLLSAPLEFTVLAGVSVFGPNLLELYNPTNLPTVHIKNIQVDEVLVQKDVNVTKVNDDELEVRWDNLTTNTIHMALSINGQRIPLAWHIRRFYTWLSGSTTSTVTEDTVNDVTIHVRGEPNQAFHWVIGEQSRAYSLNARGTLDIKLNQDALIDMLRGSSSTSVNACIRLNDETWKVFDYVHRPVVTMLKIAYDTITNQLDLKVNLSKPLHGKYTLQLYHQTSGNLKSIDISTAIHQRQSFEIALEPGHYRITIHESRNNLTFEQDISNELYVEDRVEIAESLDFSDGILEDRSRLFYALTQPARIFSSSSERLWSPLQSFLEIRDVDRWVEKNGLLPAWCVTPYRLRAYLGDQRHLYIEPEVASHKATEGIGRVQLKLEDGPVWAYASWERATAGKLYIFKSHLRLFFPPPNYRGPYSWLDDNELHTMYQCLQCGQIIGSRDGKLIVRPDILRTHRHDNNKLKATEVFFDVGNSFEGGQRLLVMIHADKGVRNANPWEPIDIFEEQTTSTSTTKQFHTPWRYRLATSQVDMDSINRWQAQLNQLCKGLLNNEVSQAPMVNATTRMLNRLNRHEDHNAALILSLALLLRSQAYLSDQDAHEIRLMLHISDDDLHMMVSDIANHSPALFEWAMYWVELFYTHALC